MRLIHRRYSRVTPRFMRPQPPDMPPLAVVVLCEATRGCFSRPLGESLLRTDRFSGLDATAED